MRPFISYIITTIVFIIIIIIIVDIVIIIVIIILPDHGCEGYCGCSKSFVLKLHHLVAETHSYQHLVIVIIMRATLIMMETVLWRMMTHTNYTVDDWNIAEEKS